jgi:hypothetical protein
MRHVRVNKLLRYGDDLSLEVLTDLFGQEVNSNDKLVINKDVTDYLTMPTEELIEMKDYLHRILNERLESLHTDYLSLKGKINNPDLYSLSDSEEEIILPF